MFSLRARKQKGKTMGTNNLDRKNSFVVYHSWLDAMNTLDNAEAAWRIMVALWKTDLQEEIPNDYFENVIELAIFKTMVDVVKANRQKYDKKCKNNVENGKRGGRPKNEDCVEEANPFVDSDSNNSNDVKVVAPKERNLYAELYDIVDNEVPFPD